jgi:two-component system response regulator AtoC
MSAEPRAPAVLIATPNTEAASTLTEVLGQLGVTARVCKSGAEALALTDREAAHAVVAELELPDMTASALLSAVGERWPGLPVILLASDPGSPQALAALQAGGADLLRTPPEPEEVEFVIKKVVTAVELRLGLPPPPPSSERAGWLGDSPAMRKVHATLERAAQSNATVLVRGENGTGKELMARAIHHGSPRREQPFVKIDCASLPENLLESELFGHERGAFTGAVTRKPGRAELADKGTLFLDEIGELTLPLQTKLLRLLQDREMERLGGTKTIKLDIRVVAATHRDLDGMVARGEFRQDLFFRLNVVDLWLPPLRARREDIGPLAHHFCQVSGAANGKPNSRLDDAAIRLLRAQKWPGNVRQLQNFVEKLVVLSPRDTLGEEDVRSTLSTQVRFETQPATAIGSAPLASPKPAAGDAPRAAPDPAPADPGTALPHAATAVAVSPAAVVPLDVALRAAEKSALVQALEAAKGNRSQAAKLLGISRSTLYTKLEEHGLL